MADSIDTVDAGDTTSTSLMLVVLHLVCVRGEHGSVNFEHPRGGSIHVLE